VVQVVAAGRLFRRGVFLRSGDALERLARIDHVVLDKTGTLTLGVPEWRETPMARAVLMEAAALARSSRHPLSRALVAAAGPGQAISGVTEVPGRGLEAEIDGERVRLGSAEWVDVEADASGASSLWYARGGADPVPFHFEDRLRDDAVEAVAALKAQGFGVEILSGDRPETVSAAAQALGLDRWQAQVSPAGKVARLEALRGEGRRVLMVGDGLNDAGALALAHAALAPGGAMDVSQSAADAVYSGGGLSAVPAIIAVATQARRRMLENFALAAVYNLIAVPVAVAGFATPLVAAIAMSASSVLVTLNALRLKA
jgi:Cu2+-exporting ATPase